MKKLFMVLSIVLSIALAGNAFAGAGVDVGDQTNVITGNEYAGHGSYNTSKTTFRGWGLTLGGTGTDGKSFATGPMEAEGFAYSVGASKVHSNSWALGGGLGKGYYSLGVEGGAWAESGSAAYKGTDPNFRTMADGGSWASGSYQATKDGKFCFIGGNSLNGNAKAITGTVNFADRGRIGDTQGWSKAGSMTGSFANASHDGEGTTNVQGAGNVYHQTYAAPKVGSSYAATFGNASYTFNNSGSNNVSGGGFAATGGSSNVTQTPNSASSHTRSFGIAFSTGGAPDQD